MAHRLLGISPRLRTATFHVLATLAGAMALILALARSSSDAVSIPAATLAAAHHQERTLEDLPRPAWSLRLTTIDLQQVPQAMATAGARILLVDARGRIVALTDSSRRVLWTLDPTSHRLRPRVVFGLGPNTVAVAGQPGQQSIILDVRNGAIIKRWPASSALWLSGCGLSGGRALVSAISDDGSLLRVGRDGAIEAVLEMPWKHLARSHSLQRQSLLARDDVTNRCIAALSASDGIAAYDTSRSVWFRGFQVPVATGRVDTERRKLEGGSFVVSSRLSPPARTGYALAASRGRAFVAIGSGAASFRIIDVHDVRDGAYLKTFRSATPVELLAASSTHLLVASSVDGYPTLIAYTMDSLIRALSRPHPR